MRKPGAHRLPQDELTADEIEAMSWPIYTEASDLDTCRLADGGDSVAYEIFHSWPTEHQRAAAQAVDKADQEQWG
jgi:hypothetical protein